MKTTALGFTFLAKKPAPRVLDACCGSRMFWFSKDHPETIYSDKRCETHAGESIGDRQPELVIAPDVVADFTALPFLNETFCHVVFDPPHFVSAGSTGWQAKKYGTLKANWRDMMRAGFIECFRVLKTGGTLVFKWNETDIPISRVLELVPPPYSPLYGNRCGKTAKSHWVVFIK